MNKPSKGKPEFSQEREFKVILEDIQSQFRVFGEGLQDVRDRLGRLEVSVTRLNEDMSLIKIAVPQIFTRLNSHEQRLGILEAAH